MNTSSDDHSFIHTATISLPFSKFTIVIRFLSLDREDDAIRHIPVEQGTVNGSEILLLNRFLFIFPVIFRV